ncbi:MAG: hypothetical protein IJU23_09135 [Proteobacteria bacterium]|nr:hypothetical protein [Pseudomonadota bacterium]
MASTVVDVAIEKAKSIRGQTMSKHKDDLLTHHHEKLIHEITADERNQSESWEWLSSEDKKMTFNELILHYNEDAFEEELPDGRKVIAVP